MLPYEFFSFISECSGEGFIYEYEFTGNINLVYALKGIFYDVPVAVLALSEQFLQAFALGDVAPVDHNTLQPLVSGDGTGYSFNNMP